MGNLVLTIVPTDMKLPKKKKARKTKVKPTITTELVVPKKPADEYVSAKMKALALQVVLLDTLLAKPGEEVADTMIGQVILDIAAKKPERLLDAAVRMLPAARDQTEKVKFAPVIITSGQTSILDQSGDDDVHRAISGPSEDASTQRFAPLPSDSMVDNKDKAE